LDHLEDDIYKLWRQGGGKPSGGTVPENVLANFQDSAMCARSQDIMLVHKRRITLEATEILVFCM